MNNLTNAPSVQELLLVLIRQRKLILAVYVGVLLTAIVGIFILPPQYRAASKVLVSSIRADISTSAERPTELHRSADIGLMELASQLEILRSSELVAQVVREMSVPAEIEQAEAQPSLIGRILGAPMALLRGAYRKLHNLDATETESDPLAPRVAILQQRTDAEAVRGSNVIEIAFTGSNPEWAREYVARLTQAYIERQAKMQREGGAEAFFVKQSEILRQKLTDSETALRAQREQAGTLAGQQAELHDRLNEFSAELARTKIARAELDERVAYLEKTASATRQSGKVATPELLALEAKRAELIGRYRPDSQRVRDIDTQIQALRSAIGSYDAVTSPTDSPQTNDLGTARAAQAALHGKEEALARERDLYRRQAEMLDSQSFDLARLERQVKLDEEAYLSYVRTAEESRLSNALEQSKMLRLAVVEPATVPMVPVSPKKGRILFFALVGGLAAGLGAALLRDYTNKTVRTAAEVRRTAELEVLAILPDRAA
jgi:uncharacterized protein involved in exopolysaccharide biosynthesis